MPVSVTTSKPPVRRASSAVLAASSRIVFGRTQSVSSAAIPAALIGTIFEGTVELPSIGKLSMMPR